MTLLDVNVLIYAHKYESLYHSTTAAWLIELIEAREPFALSDFVTTGFLRIVTHPRIYTAPSTMSEALAFIDSLSKQHSCTHLQPGLNHWSIFSDLCTNLNARGNAVPDVYLAALALEFDLTLASADKGFRRIPSLKWLNPLES